MSVTLKQFANDFTVYYDAHKKLGRKCPFSIEELCLTTLSSAAECRDWNTVIIGTKECDEGTQTRLQELAAKRPDAVVVLRVNGEYKSPVINMGIGAVPLKTVIDAVPIDVVLSNEDFIALLNKRNIKPTDKKTLRELSDTYGSKIVFDDLYVVDNTWYTRSQLSAEFPKITPWDDALFPKVQVAYLRIYASMFSGPFLRSDAQDFIKGHPAFVKAFSQLPTEHFPRLTVWDRPVDTACVDCGCDIARICEKDGKIILSPQSGYYPKPPGSIAECLKKFGISWPDSVEPQPKFEPKSEPKPKFTLKPYESDPKLLEVSCDEDAGCICKPLVAPFGKDKYVLIRCSFESDADGKPCGSAKTRAEKLGIAVLAD